VKKTTQKRKPEGESVSFGGIKARIYPSNTGGYTSWLVRYHLDGKQKSLRATSLEAAKRKAKEALGGVSSGSAHVVSLTPKESANVSAAVSKLQDIGVPLLEAVAEFCEAYGVIKGQGSLVEAARYFVAERKKREIPDITIPDLVTEFLEAKKQDLLSQRYLDDCRLRLKPFKKAMGGLVSNVTPADIDAYLRGLTCGPRSRKNVHTIIRSLFSYAQSKGFLPASEKTAPEVVGRIKMKPATIGILKPEEFEAVLRVATVKTLPAFVLGGFCGLRQAEIFRLDWSAIDFTRKHITVNADIAKTSRRRLVPLPDAAAMWLESVAQETGPVIEYASEVNLSIMMRSVWEKAKMKPLHVGGQERNVHQTQNCLRHSAASYRLAETGDAARTSLELGNSPKILMQDYRELVTAEDAKVWFSISPEKPTNVFSMGGKKVA
jgi:integrase